MLDVILKQDIYKLGDRGDVVRVADGYARNYLYPQRLAIPADKGSLRQLTAMKAAAEREALRMRGDAKKQVAALEGVVVRIVARASLNNQLYGSVTSRDVAAKLAEVGIEVDRHRIQMTTPFRALGNYEVPINIYKDIASTVTVEVRAEGREDEPLTPPIQLAPQPVSTEGRPEAADDETEVSNQDAAAEESDAASRSDDR